MRFSLINNNILPCLLILSTVLSACTATVTVPPTASPVPTSTPAPVPTITPSPAPSPTSAEIIIQSQSFTSEEQRLLAGSEDSLKQMEQLKQAVYRKYLDGLFDPGQASLTYHALFDNPDPQQCKEIRWTVDINSNWDTNNSPSTKIFTLADFNNPTEAQWIEVVAKQGMILGYKDGNIVQFDTKGNVRWKVDKNSKRWLEVKQEVEDAWHIIPGEISYNPAYNLDGLLSPVSPEASHQHLVDLLKGLFNMNVLQSAKEGSANVLALNGVKTIDELVEKALRDEPINGKLVPELVDEKDANPKFANFTVHMVDEESLNLGTVIVNNVMPDRADAVLSSTEGSKRVIDFIGDTSGLSGVQEISFDTVKTSDGKKRLVVTFTSHNSSFDPEYLKSFQQDGDESKVDTANQMVNAMEMFLNNGNAKFFNGRPGAVIYFSFGNIPGMGGGKLIKLYKENVLWKK